MSTSQFFTSGARLLAALSMFAGAAPLAAQTGPFNDGELLIRAPFPTPFLYGIYRLEPTTGQMELLLGDILTSYSKGGWITYDRRRDAVLAYCAYEPLGMFVARLLSIRADGSFTDLGFVGEDLKAMASVGDGRVYLRKGAVLHLYGLDGSMTPVLDEQGNEIDLNLDHMVYDPATQSLVGVSTTNTTPCGGFKILTAHRLPLAADGVSLSGPIVCGAYDYGLSTTPSGLDHLPGGKLVMSLGNVSWPPTAGQLFELDPVTLAMSPWAQPDSTDIDGAAWAPSLGGVVLLEDGSNELRLYFKGMSGAGILLPTSLPVGDQFSGTGTSDWLTDIDLLGPGCGGLSKAFGTGLAGTGNAVPTLGAATCPAIGTGVPIVLGNGVGGGVGLVLLNLVPANIPALGGQLYVMPPFLLTWPLLLTGAAGQAGTGFGQADLYLPDDPVLIGLPLWMQAVVGDPGATEGLSFSRGLELRIG